MPFHGLGLLSSLATPPCHEVFIYSAVHIFLWMRLCVARLVSHNLLESEMHLKVVIRIVAFRGLGMQDPYNTSD